MIKNQEIRIKKAEVTDFENCFRVINECAITLRESGMNNWERYNENKVLKMVSSSEMFILLEDDKIIGTIRISKNSPSFYNSNDLQKWRNPNGRAHYFTALAVSPKLQGKGYGEILIDFAEDVARKECSDYIRMTMYAKNQPLRRYYLKRGFTFCQQRKVQALDLELLFGEKELNK